VIMSNWRVESMLFKCHNTDQVYLFLCHYELHTHVYAHINVACWQKHTDDNDNDGALLMWALLINIFCPFSFSTSTTVITSH
jgi:hypothetical protein